MGKAGSPKLVFALKHLRGYIPLIFCFYFVLLFSIAGCKNEVLYVPGFLNGSYLIEVTGTSAIIKTGNSIEGSYPVTESGVCWGLTENPTIKDFRSIDGTGTSPFMSTLSGLVSNTLYYLRPYATSKAGTGYGNQVYIRTMAGETVDIDGNVYPTIIADEKEWFAENLRTTRLNDGSEIPIVTDDAEWSKTQSPAYCQPANSTFNYGFLYNWFTVNTGKLCPAGWHIANQDDWYSLIYPFDRNLQRNLGSKYAGCNFIKPDSTQLSGCSQITSNMSGFSALAGRWRYESGKFSDSGKSCMFWLPEDPYPNSDFNYCIYLSCSCSSQQTSMTTGKKKGGYSVRCVKN